MEIETRDVSRVSSLIVLVPWEEMGICRDNAKPSN